MTIQHEMFLSFLTCEKLSTCLVKYSNKKNFPQQLIFEWIAAYLLSLPILGEIPVIGCITIEIDI